MAHIIDLNGSPLCGGLFYVEGEDNSQFVELDQYFQDEDFSRVVYDYFVQDWGDDETFGGWLEDNKSVSWFSLRRIEGGEKYYPVCGDDEGIVYYEEVESFDFQYNEYRVTIHEDDENFYLDFNQGLDEGIYPKEDWTLEDALKDQANIYNEHPEDEE